MIEHYLGLEDARVVQTPRFLLAMENMRGVIHRRAITVLWGDSGYGKTIAGIAAYDGLPARERCWIKLTTRPNPRVITNTILHRLTGVEHDETRWNSARTLGRELARHPIVIFVDEAQNLSIDCIEFLRWLHEEHPGRFALILIGGAQLHGRLSRSPQLMRRVFQPTRFKPLDPRHIDGYLRTFHPIYERAEPGLIARVDQQHCEGNFGFWARFTASAYDVCRERGSATLTADVADLVVARHQEWGLAA
jgi:hypothetical protein